MRITCEHCRKTLNLPDDRLPASGRITIKCPCERKETIVIDLDAARAAQAAPDQAQAAPRPAAAGAEPEIFPPGSRVAFLFVSHPGWAAALKNAFQTFGFHLSSAADASEAVQKIGLNHYDALVVEDSEAALPVITEINSWNGLKRRDANVILLGGRGPSMHPQEPFTRGVNFYLNVADEARAMELVEETLKGFDLYYEPWATARKELSAEGSA